MREDLARFGAHPSGEQSAVEPDASGMGVVVDSFAGSVRVEFDHEAALTPLGQLPFFIDFLKTAGLFEAFVADCPLRYTSPNAPKKRDVLGTTMLSMLAGHKRYAHIAALRGDGVLPELLDMSKIISEDAVRRAFAAIEEEAGANWLRGHLDHCVEPLLSEPWILDVDTTVKPLYGHQEGAVVGYNPKKPGRPSHCYHTYSMAGTRLVLDVDVSAGDEHTSNHSAPGLWALLDRTPRDCWPSLLRGDKGFGNEGIMGEAERRALPYLFKLRLTAKVKRAIERLSGQSDWVEFGPRLASQRDRDSIARLEPTTARRHIAAARERRAGDARDGRGWTASARLPRHRPERGDVGISGSRDHAPRGSGKLWPALSRPRRWRECFRRVEEPMGLGRLRHSRPGALSFGGPPRGVVLRLVEHLHAIGRARSPPRGDHEPTIVVARHRRTGAPCATNDDQDRQHARQVRSRRKGASSGSPIPKAVGHKCGAVDALAALARNTLPRLPSLPQRPRPSHATAPMSILTQPQIETHPASRTTIRANCRI